MGGKAREVKCDQVPHAKNRVRTMMPTFEIDHLVYGVPSLEIGIEIIAEKFGVKPVMGGQHLGLGTHNALLGLGTDCYLEVIAPDPAQKDLMPPYWIDVTTDMSPRLIRWALRIPNLEAFMDAQGPQHPLFGELMPGQRRLPNGELLRWQLTDPRAFHYEGMIPFLIDWGTSTHPAKHLPQAGRVEALQGSHPKSSSVNEWIQKMGLNWHVSSAENPSLAATIYTHHGNIIRLQ